MIKPKNSSSIILKGNDQGAVLKYESHCNLISSHRNTEAKKLKKGVYKFFQGKLPKNKFKKVKKERRNKELETTGNQSSHPTGTMNKLYSSKVLFEDKLNKESYRNRRKKFKTKNSIFLHQNLEKNKQENELREIDINEDLNLESPLKNKNLETINLFNSNISVNEKCIKKSKIKHNGKKMGPKLDFKKSRNELIFHKGDVDTPRLKIKNKKPRRKRNRSRISSHSLNRAVIRPRPFRAKIIDGNLHGKTTHDLGKFLKRGKKKKSTQVSGILKPCSFVQMRLIKEELKESMREIEKRVEKMNKKNNKRVKFNKKMLVYKYQVKKSLTVSFDNENNYWGKRY